MLLLWDHNISWSHTEVIVKKTDADEKILCEESKNQEWLKMDCKDLTQTFENQLVAKGKTTEKYRFRC